jgi:sortase (surface protein transpeptidase)
VQAVNGIMQVPLNPRVVGWWSGGAAPGDQQGATVIVGHINYAGVDGAFAVLPQTRPGDTVTLSTQGAVAYGYRYRVVAVRSYRKTSGIPAIAFSTSGPPRLVLITCGGLFDSSTGNYEDNIVTYAEPE